MVPLIFIWLFCFSFVLRTSAYRTYYVEDNCIAKKAFQKVMYNVPANGPNSVGEMRTNRFGTYSRLGRTCLIKLVPPKGFGIVIAVQRVDFRKPEKCDDYLKVFTGEKNEKICNHEEKGKSTMTFYADDEIKILYHTKNESNGFNAGFRMSFTVAKKANVDDSCSFENQFKCSNSRCIWAGVTCDGYNNCGDWSDESIVGSASCPNVTPVGIVIISLSITVFALMLITICFCCCRGHQKDLKDKLMPTDFPSRPNGGYIPLPGYVVAESVSSPNPILYRTYQSTEPCAPTVKRTTDEEDVYSFQIPLPSALDLPPPYKA